MLRTDNCQITFVSERPPGWLKVSKSTSSEIFGKITDSPGPIIEELGLRKNSAIRSSLLAYVLLGLLVLALISLV